MAVGGHYSAQHCLTCMICICKRLTYCTAPGAAAGVKGYVCWASRPGPWPRPVAGRARSIGQSALWFFYTCRADCRERTIRVSEAGSSDVGSRMELFEATGQYIFGIVRLAKYYLLLENFVYKILCIAVASRNKRGLIQYIPIFIHSFQIYPLLPIVSHNELC